MSRLLTIRPVGTVHRLGDDRQACDCIIRLRPGLEAGLLGIEPGDRLQVLYWMHRLEEAHRQVLRVHPRGEKWRPKRGVFALRSPMRPNPIGVTEVRVKRVSEGELVVEGLDAFDGSPVVDIKVASWRDDSEAPAWWRAQRPATADEG